MSSEKTDAIVLRVVEFSESSCVVTVFTRDFGKIAALAKGARRPKSPFEAAIDVLAVCRIVFIHKSSEALDLLTEAKLERRFRAATRDLSRLYAGYYVIELLQRLTDLGDPHPELFQLADRTLLSLDGDGDVARWLLRFEMLTLRFLGVLPSLDKCVICGTPLANTPRVLFGHLAGGVLCPQCRQGQRQVVSLNEKSLTVLRQFAKDDNGWLTMPWDRRCRGEVRGLVSHFLTHLLGNPPRMHKFLGTISR